MSKGCVVVLTGPSCSGKSYLERALQMKGFGRAISHTTRAPRKGEVDGVDYHFTKRDDLQKMFEDGQLVEMVKFNDQLYGMHIASLRRAMEPTGRVVIVAEPVGAHQIIEFCRNINLAVVSCWVACSIRKQAERFIARFGEVSKEAQVSRLATMMTTELEWRASASQGRLLGSTHRYNLLFWHAGPEMEQAYIATIEATVNAEIALVTMEPTGS